MNKLVLAIAASIVGVSLWAAPSAYAATLTTDTICETSSCITPEIIDVPPTCESPMILVNGECVDDDYDSVPAPVENAAPNDGDNNYDSTPDSTQNTAASAPNPNDQTTPNSYVTLQVLNADGQEFTNWRITYFNPVKPEELNSEVPTDRNFPIGLFDLNLKNDYLENLIRYCSDGYDYGSRVSYEYSCDEIDGERTVRVRLLLDRVFDHSGWTIEQYNDILGSYSDYSAHATVEDLDIGFLRTTITWTLVDGGIGDQDSSSNGTIVDGYDATILDPIGPSVKNAVTSTDTPVVTTAVAATPTVATSATKIAAPQLANTGSNMLVSAFAVVLIVATIYVARAKQTA